MNRRKLIALLAGAASWPLTARAQQLTVPVIGYFHLGTAEDTTHVVAGFRKGLAEIGYIEGRNVTIEFRYGNNQVAELANLATDLVRRRVAVIAVPAGGTAALAAKAATTTIPIVFGSAFDPVEIGLVASLNRPGGNVTGISNVSMEISPKRLALLHELLPKIMRIGFLIDPDTRSPAFMASTTANLQAAASTLGRKIEVITATDALAIDAAFASLTQRQVGALLLSASNLFSTARSQIVTLAARYRVPVISYGREYPAAGGLMSYGASFTEQARQVGIYAGRILKGEKPADLPVMQSTKFEFVINLNTAKALGLTIPPNLRALVDEVIE